jgi:hypothetical protein
MRLKRAMRTNLLVLATFLCLTSLHVDRAWADSCVQLKAEPLTSELILQLDLARANNTEVIGFRLYDYPILITSANAPLCLAFYNQAKVEYFTLTQALAIQNGIYSFRDELNAMSAGDEEQLKFLIQDRKITKFLIYKITQIEDEYQKATNTLRVHFAFLAHEGFHLMAQNTHYNTSHYLQGQPYYSWSAEGRKFIEDTCYGPQKSIQDLAHKEIALLREAVAQAFSTNQVTFAFENIRQFLAVRAERYALLKDSQFQPGNWPVPESCAQGEAVMENIEGTADFVETIYLLKAGLIKIEEWITPQANKYVGSEYYTLGALQLMLLYKLDPQFAQLEKAIQEGGPAPAESIYTRRLRELVSAKK